MGTQKGLDMNWDEYKDNLRAYLEEEEREEFSKAFDELNNDTFYEVWKTVEDSKMDIDIVEVEYRVNNLITEKDVHTVMAYPGTSYAIAEGIAKIVFKELGIENMP